MRRNDSSSNKWLLGNRDFTLLWGGELLSEVGSQTATVAYPLLVLALTGSPAKAGVVGLAKWLPLAIFALPAGVLADRVDRKRLMIACDLIRMLGAASIVLLLLISEPAYLQIVVVAFLDGGMFITSYICERGALRQVVEPDQLQDAVAQNEAHVRRRHRRPVAGRRAVQRRTRAAVHRRCRLIHLQHNGDRGHPRTLSSRRGNHDQTHTETSRERGIGGLRVDAQSSLLPDDRHPVRVR